MLEQTVELLWSNCVKKPEKTAFETWRPQIIVCANVKMWIQATLVGVQSINHWVTRSWPTWSIYLYQDRIYQTFILNKYKICFQNTQVYSRLIWSFQTLGWCEPQGVPYHYSHRLAWPGPTKREYLILNI